MQVLLLTLLAADPNLAFLPPDEVVVRAVYFVPTGQPAPTGDQLDRLQRHLTWAQRRYQELLGTTFRLAPEPLVHAAARDLAFYRQAGEGGAPWYVAELLEACGTDRFRCPFIFVVVVSNPDDDFPGGGGRPINGGYARGGGVVILSSFALDRGPSFQSTLQHELGHGFGLLHVDAYGHDMASHSSLMSYNPAHHTRGFEPSATPGGLSAEDRRGLALNDAALPALEFRPDPADPPVEPLRWLPPMLLPGHPAYRVEVTTEAESLYGTRPELAVLGRVAPSAGPGVTFDPSCMWHSGSLADGWARLALAFPGPVRLDGLRLHTEHSGLYHRAAQLRLEPLDGPAPGPAAGARITSPDQEITFTPSTGRRWRLSLRAGPSGQLVVRGLRFFGRGRELFAPVTAPR